MSSYATRNSRPHPPGHRQPAIDALQRQRIYGKVRPMEEPGFFERLFSGWR
jgi:hypothetical protein